MREKKSPSRAVKTLALQSLNVCKYCNKQLAFLIKDAAAQRVLTGAVGPDFRMRNAASPSPLLVFVSFPRRLAIMNAEERRFAH